MVVIYLTMRYYNGKYNFPCTSGATPQSAIKTCRNIGFDKVILSSSGRGGPTSASPWSFICTVDSAFAIRIK